MSIASFAFLFATSRSFPGFAANRRRERRGRSAYYIALFCLFVVLKTSIFFQIVQNRERNKKGRKKRERERESVFVSVVAYVFQPSVFDEIDRSIDNDNYTQVSSSSRAIRREEEERKKEKTTSLLLFYAKVVDEKKRRFAESLAKVFDTKTTRCTHPNLLPRSFCCGAVRIEFVHLVVRAFHLVLFFVQRLFFFVAVMSKNEFFKKEKKGEVVFI